MPERRLIPTDRAERIQFGFALLLQAALLVVVVGSLVERQWPVAFAGAAVLALSFGPAIIERQLDVQLPIEFTLVTSVFLYAAFVLGEVRNYYERYWWWDLLLHSFSALVMGLLGFLLVYVFYMTNRIRLAPVYVAMVSFGLAVTIGTLWEVFEFLMDWSFGFNMQKSGLVDTMTDLMVNIGGAVVAAVIGYTYVKGGDALIADRLIRHFLNKNPGIIP